MSHNNKLISVLVGLTFFVILFIADLLIYKRIAISDIENSYFFIAAVAGSFYLYFDLLWKEHKRSTCYIYGFSCLLIFLIAAFYLDLMVEILLFWLLGGIHLIFNILFTTTNHTKIINTCFYISLPLCVIISIFFLVLSGINHPLVQDEFLMATDGTLGIYPSLIMGRFIRALPVEINLIFICLYLALPAAVIIIYIKRLTLEKKPPHSFIIEIILMGIFGYTLYNIIPGCGSYSAFYTTWPDGLPKQFSQTNPKWIDCPIYLPRNCLPSLHTAWIICLLRQGWLCDEYTKIMTSILAFGTLIAMFGIGQHYLVDIIVGVAFANCVGGICAFQLKWNNPARWQATLFGGLLCICWYIIILHGLPILQLSKFIAWGVFLGSIFLSIFLELNLFRAYKKMIFNPGLSAN